MDAKINLSHCNHWFNFIASISPWYGLTSSFTSILNRDCDWFMTLRLGLYFPGSFFGWFFISSRSRDPPFDLSSTFVSPSSHNIPNLYLLDSMSGFTLWCISVTYCSIRKNLTSTGPWGPFTNLLITTRVSRILGLIDILYWKYPRNKQQNLPLIPIWSINFCGYSITQFVTTYLIILYLKCESLHYYNFIIFLDL